MIPALADTLAVFRLTRLVVKDQITAHPRAKVIEWAYRHDPGAVVGVAASAGIDLLTGDAWADLVANDPDPPKLAYLFSCYWCSSAYIAAGVVLLRRLVPRAWGPVADALALSAVAGLVAENWEKS